MKEKRNLYLKILVIIAVIACLGILQVAAIKALPYPFDSLNLIIISLVFVLLLSSWHTALWWSFGLGLLLDLYSFAPAVNCMA
ncbi:MAG: hypothetical protein NTW06_02050 [Candidatus Falkowbacteria bacterium]|nr:hypothetical protein [Candidatus Falkowbacteria bacterium]